MVKHYAVLNMSKSVLEKDGTLPKLVEGSPFSHTHHKTLEAAEKQADMLARGGTIAVIYVSTEYRLVQPIPVIVETIEVS